MPAGWHVLRGWLSDVVEPVPALAFASFPARLSRHACACGMPNVRHLPRGGAFVFVWEYPHPSARATYQFPKRPTHFTLTSEKPQRYVCQGPSTGFTFRSGGSGFQVEIYLGPRVSAATRGRLVAALNSLTTRPG